MSKSCDCHNHDCDCGSNSGFIFGLLCGAVIGAIIAIIIYKNNKTEVFEKLSQKIKDYFDNLVKINTDKNSPTKETAPKPKNTPKKILAMTTITPKKQEITPVFVRPKKSVPKTFIKPKK